MVYKWRQERFPVKAQVAGEELERIQEVYNGISPQVVVEESKPEDATLHKCFEWNDTKAADKYREQQARVLIANIVTVKLEEEQEEIKPVRAFINVVDCDEPAKYVSLNTALNDENYRRQMLDNALKELISFKQKYKDLQELTEIFQAIDRETA
jgi:hypothetical protein